MVVVGGGGGTGTCGGCFVLGSTRERKANKLNPPGHRDLTPICPRRGGAPGPGPPRARLIWAFLRNLLLSVSTNQHPAALGEPTPAGPVRFLSFSPPDNLLGSAVPVAVATATFAPLLVH